MVAGMDTLDPSALLDGFTAWKPHYEAAIHEFRYQACRTEVNRNHKKLEFAERTPDGDRLLRLSQTLTS